MEVRLLGTGDAIGTPKVGCSCPQCLDSLASGRERLRTSLLVTVGGCRILVDSGPDLRRQLLSAGSPLIDALVWTHGHYDHFMGFGEFYRVQAPSRRLVRLPGTFDGTVIEVSNSALSVG